MKILTRPELKEAAYGITFKPISNTEMEARPQKERDPRVPKVFCDLHIHSKYSRATSLDMDITTIARFAQVKGLNIVGTGDFTHPKWMTELKQQLTAIPHTGLYTLKDESERSVYFMVTTEVCTIFEFDGKARRIHHVVLAPSLEVAGHINDRLTKYGDLTVDGRPTLGMSAAALVEEVLGASMNGMVIPAHAWTPWFSVFGSVGGFDRMEDCYQDMTKHIFALETGLSSDPPMNWRLSALDRYALVSNSDSHSPYPYRLGREANVFEVERLSYEAIVSAIRHKDPKRFKSTIETNPAYGKYHWTGHRACNVSMPPSESKRVGGKCPVCHRPLTTGVEERVEKLADRPAGFKPDGAIGYIHLLPLHEIICATLDIENPSSTAAWRVYNALTSRLGDEYAVLLDVERDQLAQAVGTKVAEAIIRVREDRVKVVPGYDGVYGRLIMKNEEGGRPSVQGAEAHGKGIGLDRFM